MNVPIQWHLEFKNWLLKKLALGGRGVYGAWLSMAHKWQLSLEMDCTSSQREFTTTNDQPSLENILPLDRVDGANQAHVQSNGGQEAVNQAVAAVVASVVRWNLSHTYSCNIS